MRTAAMLVCCLSLFIALPAASQEGGATIQSYAPKHLAPAELASLLGAHHGDDGRAVALIPREGGGAPVEVRTVDAANQLFLIGDSETVAAALALLQVFDVAQKQIEISATLVDVNRARALDAGLDWAAVAERARVDAIFDYTRTSREDRIDDSNSPSERQLTELDRTRRSNARGAVTLGDALHLLDASGAGRVRGTPRILTLNNRTATILDGSRVSYVSRASAYANIYETQTMDAGLKLEVLPTVGEDGGITLNVHAELTEVSHDFGDAPSKTGQIVENTIVAKDGEPVFLGGFQRRVDVKERKRFPVLGRMLPFLFSREMVHQETWDSAIVLTAHVVDQATKPGPVELQMLEDTPTKLAR